MSKIPSATMAVFLFLYLFAVVAGALQAAWATIVRRSGALATMAGAAYGAFNVTVGVLQWGVLQKLYTGENGVASRKYHALFWPVFFLHFFVAAYVGLRAAANSSSAGVPSTIFTPVSIREDDPVELQEVRGAAPSDEQP
jgi:hypothetical protein